VSNACCCSLDFQPSSTDLPVLADTSFSSSSSAISPVPFHTPPLRLSGAGKLNLSSAQCVSLSKWAAIRNLLTQLRLHKVLSCTAHLQNTILHHKLWGVQQKLALLPQTASTTERKALGLAERNLLSSLNPSIPAPEKPAEFRVCASASSWRSLSQKELKKLCKEKALPQKGSKLQIFLRLNSFSLSHSGAPSSLVLEKSTLMQKTPAELRILAAQAGVGQSGGKATLVARLCKKFGL